MFKINVSGGTVRRRRHRHGFTLFEVLLALVLLLLLAGLGILNFNGMKSGQDLDEVALQVEGMMRMAKADAANTGKRIRLTVDPTNGQLHVLWEPQPLTAPGQFVEYTAASWTEPLDMASTTVVRCQVTDPNAVVAAGGTPPDASDGSGGTGDSDVTGGTGATAGTSGATTGTPTPAPALSSSNAGSTASATGTGDSGDGADAGSTLPPGITFAPDGSCDSSAIELASSDGSDPRHAVVAIDGLSGKVDTTFTTPSDQDGSTPDGPAGGASGNPTTGTRTPGLVGGSGG